MGIINTLSGFAGYQSISEKIAGGGPSPDVYTGAVMVFAQTTAPTGWTKGTTFNDCMLRIVTGTVSNGGSVGFSTMNANTTFTGTTNMTGTSLGGTTLSAANLPSHEHGPFGPTNNVTNRPATPVAPTAYLWSPSRLTGPARAVGPSVAWSGGPHAHPISPSSVPLSIPFNTNAKYVDVILATKD
jgi:hypothetical protein